MLSFVDPKTTLPLTLPICCRTPPGWGRARHAQGQLTLSHPLHGRTLESMGSMTVSSEWRPDARLTPWILFDLDRIAWVVEQRAAELTPEERGLVWDACERMHRATTP